MSRACRQWRGVGRGVPGAERHADRRGADRRGVGRLALAVLFVTVLPACAGVQQVSERNAPGLVDLETPPEDLSSEALESPRSPGWNAWLASLEPHLGGGVAFARPDQDAAFTGFLALQASVFRGTSEPYACNDVFVFRGFGLQVGAGGRLRAGAVAEVGPVYAEAAAAVLSPEHGMAMGVGLGWGLEPVTGAHGPQVTLFNGIGYLRGAWRFGGGGEVHLGLRLTWPVLRSVWSR